MVGRAGEARGGFGEGHFGDEGQVKGAGLIEANPMQVGQLILGAGEIVEIVGDVAGIGEEKAGVEAAGATGRGDRAEQKAQRWAGAGGQEQAGFLVQFAQGGGGEGLGRGGWGGAVADKPRVAEGREGWRRSIGISRIYRAAGKDIFGRHESRARAALTHQDLRALAAFAPEDHGGGGADRQRLFGGGSRGFNHHGMGRAG